MAGISKDPGGRKRIRFVGPDGKYRSLRLGKTDQGTAKTVCTHIEALLTAKVTDTSPPKATTEWLARIEDKLHDRIVRVHLAEPRRYSGTRGMSVHQLANRYVESRKGDVRPNTLLKFHGCRQNLNEYFPATKLVVEVTQHDATRFVRWMRGTKNYAEPTVRKRIKVSRQIFKEAVQMEIIMTNPFQGVRAPDQTNEERLYFVSREVTQQLIDASPDDQWRLIIALARFGGFRCPSEVLDLKWESVDWQRKRLLVVAHKGDQRTIPLFPELLPYLQESWEAAPDGTRYAIHRYRSSNSNLRTQLARIARRAGVTMWVKPFQNMRASRETELVRKYPIHVAARWIGNSPEVALKHNLKVTEEDMAEAATDGEVSGADLKNGPSSGPAGIDIEQH